MTTEARTHREPTSLCHGCFAEPARDGPCPACGFDRTMPRPANALPLGTVLEAQFIVGRVLGKPGGFGITYLGFDRRLETAVAIKEYLPRDLATRSTDGATVVAHTSEEDGLFRYGLEQFLTEARTLAKLDHPNIVRVRHFFETNGSAYLVMDYYRGLTLAEYLDHQPGSRMAEDKALALMQPVLDGLRAVHAKGLLHRDIKPGNIYLAQTDSGGVRPILLDFGAARQAMGERSRSLSVVLSEGYAPFEQYHRKGRQGTWTDVYAAAAVLYRMLTGKTPPDAVERQHADELLPAERFGVSPQVSNAIDFALRMDSGRRPQRIEEFQALLAAVPTPEPEKTRGPQDPEGLSSDDGHGKRGGRTRKLKGRNSVLGLRWALALGMLLGIGLGVYAWLDYFEGADTWRRWIAALATSGTPDEPGQGTQGSGTGNRTPPGIGDRSASQPSTSSDDPEPASQCSMAASEASALASYTPPSSGNPVSVSELFPSQDHARKMMAINQVLERLHYRELVLDDHLAERILANYFETLDPNRLFFLARDWDRFKRGAHRLDKDLSEGKVDTAFDIFRVYRMRVDMRVEHANTLIAGGVDFTHDENYRLDRSAEPWANTESELNEIWRKRVKNDWLALCLSQEAPERIPQRLLQRYGSIAGRVHQFEGDDVFETLANAYAQAVDPHTAYRAPRASKDFDISMRLSLEGIGAILGNDNEYTIIQRTVPGGPASQSGQIHGGDRIVGVAQGSTGVMEDVVGWRLQDVVGKLRGPKSSVVRLRILPKSAGLDSRPREVSLVRAEIKLEDQAAKSDIIDQVDNTPSIRVGVIEVPSFYRDFGAASEGTQDFRSVTRDVRRLLADFARKGIEGVVIDLRGNGGGAMDEAKALTGLFIDRGPVVQVKDSFGKVEVEVDPDPGIAYSGPLVVLVDRHSASASEIFAGAIQDYRRGIIIGEPTFGKGSVETLIDLNRYVPSGEQGDLGHLQVSTAEFFRISGASTQIKGIEPDIEFPSAAFIGVHGERALQNPLPWSRIRPAHYSLYPAPDIAWLRQRSLARIATDPGFSMLTDRERLLREAGDEVVVSLHEQIRRRQFELRSHNLNEPRNRFLRGQGITPIDEDNDNANEEDLKRQQEVITQIWTIEAARILADMIAGKP